MDKIKYKKYKEYLQSEQWETKKEELFKLKWRKCQKCWSIHNLQAHHWSYRRLTREDVEKDLFVLCKKCHQNFHSLFWMRKLLKSTIHFISTTAKPLVTRLTRTEADNIVPTQEFIDFVKSWWVFKWNPFSKSRRLWNSIQRRFNS